MRPKNLVLLLMLVSILTLSFSGCVERTQDSDVDSGDVVSEPIEVDAVIYISEYEFHPYIATISSGDTVQWVNNDSVAFIIKGNLVGGDSFQSPTLRKGDTFVYTFDDAGTYKYELVTHPWTKGGQIVVE
ncbi:hypothetical protein [Methanolobus sp. WCC4]|uniref:cupredoxin domain-containing protein n=1 Tax=Methanolobus sp. WCC4 TaxID=3125784 RepID=UPI0030F90F09